MNRYQDTRPGTPSQFVSHSHRPTNQSGSFWAVSHAFTAWKCSTPRCLALGHCAQTLDLGRQPITTQTLGGSSSRICVARRPGCTLSCVQNAHYDAASKCSTQHTLWKARPISLCTVKVAVARRCSGVQDLVRLLGCKKSREPLVHGVPATKAHQLCGSQIPGDPCHTALHWAAQ